jgi:transposase
VHKKSVQVCILPPQGQRDIQPLEREFRTFSRDLRRLKGWLKGCQVTEVVMESTGQYWRAVWNVLEGEIPRLVLVNPQHVKALAGRKTDRIDSRRLARYLENQDLQGSFVAPREIRELRDVTRSRVHLLEEVNRVKNRIGQMCEAGNIKVSSVATDLFGVSGRRMLEAVAEGRRDAGWMADYARGTLRGKKKQLERALEGSFTDAQRGMLRRELAHLEFLEGQIAQLEQQIEQRLQPYQEQIRRLMTIPGVDRITGWTILAELGPDMSVFPDAHHAASWAGLCPGNRESGGKRLPSKTRKANRYLRRALCQAAWGASHSQGTYLAALYRRQRGRLGHNQAIIALAHQLLLIAYTLLRDGQDYRELGADYFDRKNKPKVVNRLVQRLTRLGFYVTLQEAAALSAEPEPVSPHIAAAVLTAESVCDAPSSDASVAPVKRSQGRPCKCAMRSLVCHHKTAFRTQPPINLSL